MADHSPMAADSATGAAPRRSSDPQIAVARLQATLDGLTASFDRALARLDSNAERQDAMIANATVALAEARRILEKCDEANRRIDGMPSRAELDALMTRINSLAERIDNLDRGESVAQSVARAVRSLPWWKLLLVCGAAAAALVLR
jgi:signal transduction protein with GAF and PtsI domain